VFLMVSTRVPLRVLGVNPFTGVSSTRFVDGDCLLDLFLGRHTGDGNLMGRCFG
jgi:hypothetical protein